MFDFTAIELSLAPEMKAILTPVAIGSKLISGTGGAGGSAAAAASSAVVSSVPSLSFSSGTELTGGTAVVAAPSSSGESNLRTEGGLGLATAGP